MATPSILVFEHDELLGLVAGVDHLPIFVIGHGRDAVGLLLKQRVDVEALLHHLDAARRAVGREFELPHPIEERIFVAVEPDAKRAALEILGLLDAGVGAAGQLQTRMLERLRDVDHRRALLARRERRRHPVDDDIGAAARQHLLRRDVRAAGLDRDVEPFILVEALVLGDVIAGELGLRDPFQLQRDLVGRLRRSSRPRTPRRLPMRT